MMASQASPVSFGSCFDLQKLLGCPALKIAWRMRPVDMTPFMIHLILPKKNLINEFLIQDRSGLRVPLTGNDWCLSGRCLCSVANLRSSLRRSFKWCKLNNYIKLLWSTILWSTPWRKALRFAGVISPHWLRCLQECVWRSVFWKLTIHLISKPILPYSFEIDSHTSYDKKSWKGHHVSIFLELSQTTFGATLVSKHPASGMQ